jgi:hypothetical protein
MKPLGVVCAGIVAAALALGGGAQAAQPEKSKSAVNIVRAVVSGPLKERAESSRFSWKDSPSGRAKSAALPLRPTPSSALSSARPSRRMLASASAG